MTNIEELKKLSAWRRTLAENKAKEIKCKEEQAEALAASPHECVRAEAQVKLRGIQWDRSLAADYLREADVLDWAVLQIEGQAVEMAA